MSRSVSGSWDQKTEAIEGELPLSSCPQCGGTGSADSGGVTPWGESVNIPCPWCAEAVVENTIEKDG